MARFTATWTNTEATDWEAGKLFRTDKFEEQVGQNLEWLAQSHNHDGTANGGAIIPTADRSKATVRVRIAIDTKDPRVLPEMGVRVSFLDEVADQGVETADAVLIPANAIREGAEGSVVFVLEGDHVRERRVTPAGTVGDRRIVAQGLSAGEQVVRDPPLELADGAKVAPRAL